MKKERTRKQVIQADWAFNRRCVHCMLTFTARFASQKLLTEAERRTIFHILEQAERRNDSNYAAQKSELP